MTALFVERDRSYLMAVRRVRYAVDKEEYASTARRPALLARVLAEAAAALRSEDEEVIGPAPVTLELDADTKEVKRQFDYPDGMPSIRVPGRIYIQTTYANYAEVLPHLDLTPQPAPELDRETLVALAQANSALRSKLLEILGTAAHAEAAPRKVEESNLIDLRLRVIVRRPDYRVLVSKQSEDGSKIITSNGIVE